MSTKQQSSHNRPSSTASANTSISSSNKNRQYAHLHAQLAQLNAHLADTENLVRMTAVQRLWIEVTTIGDLTYQPRMLQFAGRFEF